MSRLDVPAVACPLPQAALSPSDCITAYGERLRSREYFQHGVTRGSYRLDVCLDGEPRPQALAASKRDGWVVSQVIGAAGDPELDIFERVKIKTERGVVTFRRSL